MKHIIGLAPALACIVVLGVAAPAVAQTSLAVPYADLDLTRPQAAARLDERLVRASRRVCAALGPTLKDMARAQQCQRETLATARAEAARLQATMVAGRSAPTTGS